MIYTQKNRCVVAGQVPQNRRVVNALIQRKKHAQIERKPRLHGLF